MIITIIRHGQTEMNVNDLVCGRTDIPLTEKGLLQAETSAKIIIDKINSTNLDKLEPITKIVSSPLIRAKQTAQILSDNLNIPFTVDERLIEQNYGIFEGHNRLNPNYLKVRSQFAVRYPEGESMMDVVLRTYSLLDDLKKENDNDHILLVTHGGTCRILMTYFQDMTNEEFAGFRANNCEFYTFHG